MEISDRELREMVRDAIARQAHGALRPPREPAPAFTLFPLSRGADGDGACLIEPDVRCTHCGYCQSFGH